MKFLKFTRSNIFSVKVITIFSADTLHWMMLSKWWQLEMIKSILLHQSEQSPSSAEYSLYTMYSGIIPHFKEADILCLPGSTNTLCKMITKGLSFKFWKVYQILNSGLKQWLQWEAFECQVEMNFKMVIYIKKKKSSLVSSKLAQVILPGKELPRVLSPNLNTLPTSVFSTVEECYFLHFTWACIWSSAPLTWEG